MKPQTAENSSRGGVGVWAGLGVGVVVWVLYFIQATVLTPGLFWDVFVVPILVTIALGGAVAAYLSTTRKRWWIEFASGVIVVLPIAVEIILTLFAVLELE